MQYCQFTTLIPEMPVCRITFPAFTTCPEGACAEGQARQSRAQHKWTCYTKARRSTALAGIRSWDSIESDSNVFVANVVWIAEISDCVEPADFLTYSDVNRLGGVDREYGFTVELNTQEGRNME